MKQLDIQEELTTLEKKIQLEKHDEWTRAKIKKDWKREAAEGRRRILEKYGSPLQAPMEPVQTINPEY